MVWGLRFEVRDLREEELIKTTVREKARIRQNKREEWVAGFVRRRLKTTCSPENIKTMAIQTSR